ncbi:hypothetical protein FJZ28_02105 [Candidatus Peregrinibacteria bacterium]|nr:hypothetical protein [Candidatus Peregrinibacteria bacterium]
MKASEWLTDWQFEALVAIENLTSLRQGTVRSGNELTKHIAKVFSTAQKLLLAYEPLDFAIDAEDQKALCELKDATELFLQANAVHDCHQDNIDLLKYEIRSHMNGIGKRGSR